MGGSWRTGELMKKVTIGGIAYTLPDTALIGSGGEGSVYRLKLPSGEVAVKVYHTPTAERSAKVRDFLSQRWALPRDRIALPLEAVSDSGGRKIIGITMPYLGSGFEEIAAFANRKFRATHSVTNRQVTTVFLDGGKVLQPVHSSGLVVGDLNERNVLFSGKEMLFIDVDRITSMPCRHRDVSLP
jgi:DNA-binding helix-hairpin-helix protein with protein kinase domain